MHKDFSPEAPSGVYGAFPPRSVRNLMEEAMRIACAADGAPGRCRQKACHRSGRCHFAIEKNGDGVCRGGIRDSVMQQAALMLFFVAHIGGKAAGKAAGETVGK